MGASGGGDPRQGGAAIFVFVGIPLLFLIVALPWVLLFIVPAGLWWLVQDGKNRDGG